MILNDINWYGMIWNSVKGSAIDELTPSVCSLYLSICKHDKTHQSISNEDAICAGVSPSRSEAGSSLHKENSMSNQHGRPPTEMTTQKYNEWTWMNKYENSRQPPYLHHIVLAAKTPTPQPRPPLRRCQNPRPLPQIPKISVPQPLGLSLRVDTVM